jgi:hypothetical protein
MAATATVPKEVKREIITSWGIAVEPEWKVCLLTSAFTYVSGTHVYYTDLTNELPTGGGYTVGGTVVTRYAWGVGATGYSGTNAAIDADDAIWVTATFANVLYAVVYETAGGKIRAVYQFDAAKTVTSGTFTIQWNAAGLIRIS